MTGEEVKDTAAHPEDAAARGYDPFARGAFPVGVRTIRAHDAARGRLFTCEVWYPAAQRHAGQDSAPETQDSFVVPLRGAPRRQRAVRDAEGRAGTYPPVVFSHGSAAGARRMATYLCTHLASHGYLVAALDHSEVFAPELQPAPGETDEQRRARAELWIASRVPDVRFLLDQMLGGEAWDSEAEIDSDRVGIVGYSFGGWTALAAPEVEPRVRAVVALAPGGASNPKPGIIAAQLTFAWGRDVPTLYLAAENDVLIPPEGVRELFARTHATKLLVFLRRADHAHFLDDAEREHETVRTMPWPGNLAWIPKEMLPITELCTEEQSHLFARGLTVCHLDATLKQREDARHFLDGDIASELAARGVETTVHRPGDAR